MKTFIHIPTGTCPLKMHAIRSLLDQQVKFNPDWVQSEFHIIADDVLSIDCDDELAGSALLSGIRGIINDEVATVYTVNDNGMEAIGAILAAQGIEPTRGAVLYYAEKIEESLGAGNPPIFEISAQDAPNGRPSVWELFDGVDTDWVSL
jgi:hypothetical protein